MDLAQIELEILNILSTFSKDHEEETRRSIENSWDYYSCLYDDEIKSLKRIFTKICSPIILSEGTTPIWFDPESQQDQNQQAQPNLNSSSFFPPGKFSYSSRYVRPVQLNSPEIKEVLSIKSFMGTGKTAALIQYLKNCPFSRILVLSPRQLFSENIQAEFNMHSLNFQSYLSFYGEDKFQLSRFDRLIIQMESLYLLQKFLQNTNDEDDDTPYQITSEIIPFYDIIILDEVESCLK